MHRHTLAIFAFAPHSRLINGGCMCTLGHTMMEGWVCAAPGRHLRCPPRGMHACTRYCHGAWPGLRSLVQLVDRLQSLGISAMPMVTACVSWHRVGNGPRQHNPGPSPAVCLEQCMQLSLAMRIRLLMAPLRSAPHMPSQGMGQDWGVFGTPDIALEPQVLFQ